ncbi:MAG: adenylosuccinate synthase [Chloroflexota bacterium]|nr:adenylosuccinate synthase [Chloroflexota bacterium]
MSTVAVLGAQWGDEGKGKVVDRFAQHAEMVVRFQGGNNAGHTVINDQGTFALHLAPSGIFNPQVTNILGPGTVVNAAALLDELEDLRSRANLSFDRFWIAERAHAVMPYHVALDAAEEAQRGDLAQGTTLRGIGPAYADKAARSGVRMGDLLDADYLQEWLPLILEPKNRLLEHGYGVAPQDPQALIDQALEWGEALAPHIVDTLPIVGAALNEDRRILLEGQLGVMRDLDWGHYPYVTSSSPSAGGACVGAGIPPRELDQVWGVAKAFSSSVGEGPFPTELFDATAEHLREVAGGEYGASTGRPRRCGWFDAVAVRTAAALSGIDCMALTKVDALDGLERIKVAVAYELDGERTELAPDTRKFDRARPIYEEFPGWMFPTEGISDLDDLPPNARSYVEAISQITGIPLGLIGTGRHRDDAIILRDPFGAA